MMPRIVPMAGHAGIAGAFPCKGKRQIDPPACPEPAEYFAEWLGGRNGNSICQRPLCRRHAEAWAGHRGAEMPA